jgi:hypothetical protein
MAGVRNARLATYEGFGRSSRWMGLCRKSEQRRQSLAFQPSIFLNFLERAILNACLM